MAIVAAYKNWPFKYSALLVAMLLALFYVVDFPAVRAAIAAIEAMGYFGAVLAGCFFVLSFTVVPATILLLQMATTLHPVGVALAAGIGAVLGDYLIFRFLRDRVFEELQPVFFKCGGEKLMICLRRPYLAWLLPVLGAIIIASPFPDEIGIGLLGASSLKGWQFIILSFVLNSIGIFALLLFL